MPVFLRVASHFCNLSHVVAVDKWMGFACGKYFDFQMFFKIPLKMLMRARNFAFVKADAGCLLTKSGQQQVFICCYRCDTSECMNSLGPCFEAMFLNLNEDRLL